MTGPVYSGSVELAGGTIEVQDIPATGGSSSPLVLLHEGLGSVSIWRDLPREPGYMHAEAEAVLPDLLREMRIDEPILVGHSDGASIALIHAANGSPVRAIVAMAPHAFVEECTIEGARAARAAYLDGDLRDRLARHHRDVDGAFFGWNDIWLSDSFRDWSIEDRLPDVQVPVLLVQCRDDPYGTLGQLDRIESSVPGPVERLVLPSGGHAPHNADRSQVLGAIAGFAEKLG